MRADEVVAPVTMGSLHGFPAHNGSVQCESVDLIAEFCGKAQQRRIDRVPLGTDTMSEKVVTRRMSRVLTVALALAVARGVELGRHCWQQVSIWQSSGRAEDSRESESRF